MPRASGQLGQTRERQAVVLTERGVHPVQFSGTDPSRGRLFDAESSIRPGAIAQVVRAHP